MLALVADRVHDQDALARRDLGVLRDLRCVPVHVGIGVVRIGVVELEIADRGGDDVGAEAVRPLGAHAPIEHLGARLRCVVLGAPQGEGGSESCAQIGAGLRAADAAHHSRAVVEVGRAGRACDVPHAPYEVALEGRHDHVIAQRLVGVVPLEAVVQDAHQHAGSHVTRVVERRDVDLRELRERQPVGERRLRRGCAALRRRHARAGLRQSRRIGRAPRARDRGYARDERQSCNFPDARARHPHRRAVEPARCRERVKAQLRQSVEVGGGHGQIALVDERPHPRSLSPRPGARGERGARHAERICEAGGAFLAFVGEAHPHRHAVGGFPRPDETRFQLLEPGRIGDAGGHRPTGRGASGCDHREAEQHRPRPSSRPWPPPGASHGAESLVHP